MGNMFGHSFEWLETLLHSKLGGAPGREGPGCSSTAAQHPGACKLAGVSSYRGRRGVDQLQSHKLQNMDSTLAGNGCSPGMEEGAVSTVKMDGSGWSKLTALTAG